MKTVENIKQFNDLIESRRKEDSLSDVLFDSTPAKYPCMVWFQQDIDCTWARIEYEQEIEDYTKRIFENFAGEGTFLKSETFCGEDGSMLITAYIGGIIPIGIHFFNANPCFNLCTIEGSTSTAIKMTFTTNRKKILECKRLGSNS